MKILMTGAHLTPALAMIDHIQKKHSKDELVFVGRLFSQEKLKQKAIEADEIKKKGVKFIPFKAIKFVNNSGMDLFLSFLSFPKSVRRAKKILQAEKIEAFLSFGSYLAVPFALAAKQLNIPIVTHEQTIVMGKANQFIANLADQVAISFSQTADYLKKDNYVLTGNPVRANLFAKDLKRPDYLPATAKKIILVMGGNQGSFVLNELVKNNLEFLLKDFTVVHQCGRANKLRDYPQELAKIKKALPKKLAERYFIRQWIEEKELFWLYQHAHFAISRSGANSVLEMCLAPLPAILIPLPNTYNDEQRLNAEMMANAGGAIILDQEKLKQEYFQNSVLNIEKERLGMRQSLSEEKFYSEAPAKIYQLLIDVQKK